MAWSRVSGATLASRSNTYGSSWNCGNLGAAVEANDRLILVFAGYTSTGETITGITDSLSNTWAELYGDDLGTGMNHAVWSTVSSAGTPSNITIAFDIGCTQKSVVVAAYRGLNTDANPVDLAALVVASESSSPADSGTTAGTTTVAGGLKIGFGWIAPPRTVSAGTLDATYTLDVAEDGDADAPGAALETVDSGSSGSTARATMGLSGYCSWRMGVMVIKPAAASDSITLTSPDTFSILVEGTYTGTPTGIEANFDGQGWVEIDDSPGGGTFSAYLTGLTAGSGNLQVRHTDATGVTDGKANVSVGVSASAGAWRTQFIGVGV